MRPSSEFLVGVIEGFYGRPWPPQTRLAYPQYLARAGLNTCLYCPKDDHYLRKHWQQHWPQQQWQHLAEVAAAHRQHDICWGVGLSPFDLYRNYGPSQRQQLRQKVQTLATLEAPLLAILFDDMPGDFDQLASRQAEIVHDVAHWLTDTRILVCPTYYSFDPALERYFGSMPDNYWPQLGRELPTAVDLFWTGNKVCSDAVAASDIEAITCQLGRPVMLWDNYPVNDGAVRSNFLYLSKLGRRDDMSTKMLSGHLCNAMNQGILSLPALSGLAELYGDRDLDSELLAQALGPRTWTRLQADREDFEQLGLSGMGELRCRELAAEYQAIYRDSAEPAAIEVAGWLRGEYVFDPACLTD